MRGLGSAACAAGVMLFLSCNPSVEGPENRGRQKVRQPSSVQTMEAVTLDITGTYRLVRRELTDGTEILPPHVEGMLTYTERYRNFNVAWTTDEGDRVSISYIARYELLPTTYQETPISWVLTDPTGVSYDPPAEKTEPMPVTLENGRLSFDMLGEPVSVAWEDGVLIATDDNGAFVDTWERVD